MNVLCTCLLRGGGDAELHLQLEQACEHVRAPPVLALHAHVYTYIYTRIHVYTYVQATRGLLPTRKRRHYDNITRQPRQRQSHRQRQAPT